MELKTNASSSTIERSEVFAFTVLRAFDITSNEKKIMPGVLSCCPPENLLRFSIGSSFSRPRNGDRQNNNDAARDQLLAELESHQDETVVD